MSRYAAIPLALALLAAAAPAARAQAITYTTSNAAFGPAISLTGFATTGFGLSNFDLGNGVSLTTDGRIFAGAGLISFTSATFSGLGGAPGVTGFGVTWGSLNASGTVSATFSNGGSDGSRSVPSGISFSGYTSTTSFTSVTITRGNGFTPQLTDFRLITAAAIPEPSGLLSGGALALGGLGAALARRRRK
jgi:MYXO-CTERM domain-containing protein